MWELRISHELTNNFFCSGRLINVFQELYPSILSHLSAHYFGVLFALSCAHVVPPCIVRLFSACLEPDLCERVIECKFVDVTVKQCLGTQINNFDTLCTLVCNTDVTGSAYIIALRNTLSSVRHELLP
jgi:hypothetical protein